MALRRGILRGVAVALCVTAVLGIVALLGEDVGDLQVQVLLTTTALSLYGMMTVAPALLAEEGRDLAVAGVALALAIAAAILALVLIWGFWDADDGDGLARVWGVVSELALAGSLVAAARPRSGDSGRTVGLRHIAAGLTVLLAAMAVVATMAPSDRFEDGYFKAMAVIGILDLLAFALVPVLARAEAQSGGSRFACVTEDGERVEVEVARLAGARAFAAAAGKAERQARRPIVSVERL